jgi:hypothetical protein
MTRELVIKALLGALALLLAGCETLSPEDRPDPRPAAAWEKQLAVLKCDYRRHSVSVRSRDPLVFASMAVCYGGKLLGNKPGLGYMSLLAIDTGRNEVQATRITANREGGLHYTASGDLMWFSTANGSMSYQDQRFIEVFTAPAGTVQERSLGRLEIPFAANPPGFHAGEGCHLLTVSALRESAAEPFRQLMWIFRDESPIATARPVEGVGRVLYWDPVGKYFVTQKQVYLDGQARHSTAPERSRLTCSGEVVPLAVEEASRLANVTYMNATYLPLPNGDLVVASESQDQDSGLAGELLVFRGSGMDRIGPFSVPYPDCPDLACAQLGFSVLLEGASATGRHFLAQLIAVDLFTVYRVDDLARARRWETRESSDRYVHLLIDDNTVMQLERGGRVSYYSW